VKKWFLPDQIFSNRYLLIPVHANNKSVFLLSAKVCLGVQYAFLSHWVIAIVILPEECLENHDNPM
jgi:hypothetical protein